MTPPVTASGPRSMNGTRNRSPTGPIWQYDAFPNSNGVIGSGEGPRLRPLGLARLLNATRRVQMGETCGPSRQSLSDGAM